MPPAAVYNPLMRRATGIVLALALLICAAKPGAQVSTSDGSLLGPSITHENTPIISPRSMSAHDPLSNTDTLKPTVTIEHTDDLGYNLIYTFTNDTNKPRPLGRLVVGAITLGERVRYLSVLRGTRLPETTWDSYTGQAWRYPLDAYSTATAIMNDDYAVGVSLLYPIETYKHDALVRVGRAGGAFKGPKESRGWYVAFDLSNKKNPNQHTVLSRPASLKPGETRTYTVAVRAMKRPGTWTEDPTGEQDWLETLVPYRDYFQSRFGPVEYTRDDRAVKAVEAANAGTVSASNPRGFFGDRTSRPDLAGFGTLVARLSERNGFDRVMLWAPSGIYPAKLKLNFPNMFTLGWNDMPMLRTSWKRFRDVPRTGKQLGLWWGRAAEFTDSWDAHTLESLDLSDPEHLAGVSLRLDMASQSGATHIGLDNFVHTHMPIWEQVRYLRAVRKIFPELTLIAEPMCCDIIHSVTPSFTAAYRGRKNGKDEEDFHKLVAPNYLADFMLPGHESWAFFRYAEIVRASGANITATRTQRDITRIASLGYVPVFHTQFPLAFPERSRAAKTWLTTVPKHLRQSAPAQESDTDSD